MQPAIVDTSVWIDFFNNAVSPETETLSEMISGAIEVYLTPTILQEILQGFSSDKDYSKAKDLLEAFPMVTIDQVDAAVGAAELYRRVRKKGKTIRRSNDCLIAYFALKKGLPLLQKDRDFPAIASVTDLRLVECRN